VLTNNYPKNNHGQYKKFLDKKECDVPLLHRPAVRTVDKYDIMICLPPKCGTTNWQRGMNVLQSLS